ncbi:hypothetical protein GCWU000282_00896 [Catonella morbi ATCC 51271]|uniref:Uncharacterized protein n=1 Tax=Catonella morbi ATCC 51271 TaxID=592026 RepID=V2Y7S2_9FIRM|nr:hypothetical protein [Catonella morbi]ESL03731.1 hypothetical protein GCWU000282_00896 [Catonella morbi ATCC 51271]
MMVEFYEYEGLGTVVDPESETKEVFIPSPPTMATLKINPRPVVIYVTGGKVIEGYEGLEALKKHCEDNKVVFMCPTSTDAEEVAKTFDYIQKNTKNLNVKRDELTVMALPELMEVAQEIVDYFVDEKDADVDDATEFSI